MRASGLAMTKRAGNLDRHDGGTWRPGARLLARRACVRAFELGGQTLAFVVEGLGTKSMIARAVLEEQGDQPLRRRRLRHGGGDRQRPLLRRCAAGRGQRLLRHGQHRPGTADEPSDLGRSGRGLAAGV